MANTNNQNLILSPYSRVKVYWDDLPMNYSKEAKNRIRSYFSNKYGLNKNNINVVYRPVRFNDKGDMIEITGAGIENIMDINYQRSLMKEIIARDGKTIDFNRILALDDKVNGELNVDLTISQHKNWSLKWVMVDNFLSFGHENYFPLEKLKGLTVVNSDPPNTGGKTTLTIDAVKFLLHGTTTKTDRNEQIFNLYSGVDLLSVRGMIDIEGDEVIIERKMRRSAKKGGGWTVTNVLNYYKLLPDGSEERQNEEDAKQTTKKLKETIGNEKDFELLVLATEKTLDDLIGLTTTESGKVLTRLIGLEILEMKEEVSRKMYNEFAKKKKSNDYDVITLGNDIIYHNEKIVEGLELETNLRNSLEETKNDILKNVVENDRLLSSKENVDVTIFELNPSKLKDAISELSVTGKALKEKSANLVNEIESIGTVIFDEDKHYALTKERDANTSEDAVKDAEFIRLKKVISDLIAGGICQSCNRKLDTVDNSEHIQKHENQCSVLADEINVLLARRLVIDKEINELNKVKTVIDNKNRLELDKDRTDVEIGSLRNIVSAKLNDLKKYNLNLEAIELNKRIDGEISIIKTNINVLEYTKDGLISKIERVIADINTNRLHTTTKTNLIDLIKKEEEVDKIFKTYIELVGKKGISKLVLRSVLPIINSELQRLLDDMYDFEVEIYIDDKNDVQFLISSDGVSRPLKSASGLEKTVSSVALRCVLGKISTLPMPNFISFDEVLGKVAEINLEKIKPLFDKIKDMYDIVFFITHNDSVKDWSTNIVTVVKKNNISSIKIS